MELRKTTMAEEQAQPCCPTDGFAAESASARERDALAVAVAVSLCLLHDLLGVAVFLASHPLHAVYVFIFARGLLSLAAFFCPLLVSTSLLLAVLATVGPYVSGAEWPGVRSLGRTVGIAVAALCAELRPDGAGTGLVGQLCSFVLGPTDAASVLCVGEIMGEPCGVTAYCFVLGEEKSLLLVGGDQGEELAFALPLMGSNIGDRSFLDYEDFGDFKDKADEKDVISDDLKGSDSLAEQCCPRDTLFVQEMEAEEEKESHIQGQDLILSSTGEDRDGVEEKRLECDPVSVEIKKSEPVQKLEIKKFEPVQQLDIKKLEAAQAAQIKEFYTVEPLEIKECKTVQATQINKLQPTLEINKSEPGKSVEIKKIEMAKPRSSIAQRIKLWEAQVSGNAKLVVEDKEENSVELRLKYKSVKDTKNSAWFVGDPCASKCGSDEQQAQEVASNEECVVEQEREQELKDVKEYMPSETETGEKCSQDVEAEEIIPAVTQAEQELLEQDCNDVQAEAELQEPRNQTVQPEQEQQEMEEVYRDVTQSPAMWNERESPLKSTSIAGRVHSRTSSENLVSEVSPLQKEKDWKRTLACKLYDERMQLRLCRDHAVVEGSENMDMLWEAYEVGSGNKGKGVKHGGHKAKGGTTKVEELVEESEEEEEEENDGDDEGSVRQLCCLQVLKFSTRKMNFGGGKPSLSKISRVLKRMTALSRMGSWRKRSDKVKW
ncbi:hypothetical protein BS78_05G133900 [Paspalum vaginatum]|nr:hypothetical protein BS78_05G133900 [Paspalum vaginatum]